MDELSQVMPYLLNLVKQVDRKVENIELQLDSTMNDRLDLIQSQLDDFKTAVNKENIIRDDNLNQVIAETLNKLKDI